MKALERDMLQKVQTLKKAMVNRLQALEDLQSDTSEEEL